MRDIDAYQLTCHLERTRRRLATGLEKFPGPAKDNDTLYQSPMERAMERRAVASTTPQCWLANWLPYDMFIYVSSGNFLTASVIHVIRGPPNPSVKFD